MSTGQTLHTLPIPAIFRLYGYTEGPSQTCQKHGWYVGIITVMPISECNVVDSQM